jgi:subtilisin family serine protease
MTLARHSKRVALAAGFVVLLATVALGVRHVTAEVRGEPALAAGETTVEEPVAFSLTANRQVRPLDPGLPGRDGVPRPVASLADDTGHQVDFVADELLLSTDDEEQLEALLERWDGQLVATLDPEEGAMAELPALHLVRVDVSSADPATVTDHLDPSGRAVGGALRVSSKPGARLLAVALQEAAAGVPVEVNWLTRPMDFRDRESTEAPAAFPRQTLEDRYPGPNAFDWTTHRTGGGQDIGVAEAWRVLELAGGLDIRVRVAIVDSGFRLDDDTPAEPEAVAVDPGVEPIGTPGSSFDPWHGQRVLNAAMAAADNGYGGAGPAGPVAAPIIVHTGSDIFSRINGLWEARQLGADIVNVSWGAAVPGKASGFTHDVLRAAVRALRSDGVLVVAAAGNDGADIDAETCRLGPFFCRPTLTVLPCEFSGVICVGGLDWDSPRRHPDSRYGADDVDIFAPFEVWVAVGPESDPNQAGLAVGTSFSAPFVAGVAALVWAADPDLTAGEVESILLETAHSSPDPTVGRYVNALDAVLAATSVAPELTVHTPADGAQVEAGVPVRFVATANDYEDGEFCCEIGWSYAASAGIRIPIGGGERVEHTFTGPGRYTVFVSARDSDGRIDQETLTIEVVNSPPDVQITQPTDGEEIPPGTPYQVRATATDPNEPQGRLDCASLRWTSSVAADPFPLTGCRADVTFTTAGPRTLTVAATDSRGATASDSVEVTVGQEPPEFEAPAVQILSPADGLTIPNKPDGLLGLDWEATDPAGEGLQHRWTVSYPYDPATGTAGTTEPITEREIIYPHSWIAWRPFDNLGDSYCDLAEATVRVSLEVTDAAGRTGTDAVLLRTQPCIVVQ